MTLFSSPTSSDFLLSGDRPSETKAIALPEASEDHMSPINLLIVHHETATRLILTDFLQSEGYSIYGSADWEAAFEQLQNHVIDLVILDLAISQQAEGGRLGQLLLLYPNIRVVMICDHCSLEDAVDAMKQGAVDFIHEPHGYLQRPFNPERICTVVAEALSHPLSAVIPTGDFDELIELARHCARRREIAQARKLIGEAMKQAPERPESLTLLGVITECSGDRLEALKLYRAALGLDPTYQPAAKNLERATTNLRFQPSYFDDVF
jgi:FixJ family two-component response regulator